MHSSVDLTIEPRYRAYRRESARMGLTMLVFLLLFEGLPLMFTPVQTWLILKASDPSIRVILRDVCDMIVYSLSFFLPVLFHRLITPRRERVPLPLSPSLPHRVGLVIPAAMAIILTASVMNGFLVRLLGIDVGGGSAVSPDPSARPFETVLLYMASALIPAFFEELLFRGTVLSALLPYGKTVAILGSGVLFGLMHQNSDQLFYATVAGIVLGYLAIEGGSIWAGVIVHSFNNLLSVLDSAFWDRLPYTAEMILLSILEVAIIGSGMVCLAILLHRGLASIRADRPLRTGAPMAEGGVRGFFTLPMLLFFTISVTVMVLWIYIHL